MIVIAMALAAATVGDVKNFVRSKLKDPASAVFSGLRPLRHEGAVNGYCGHVNARNGFGGYTGNSVFYVTLPEGRVVILPPEVSSVELCQ